MLPAPQPRHLLLLLLLAVLGWPRLTLGMESWLELVSLWLGQSSAGDSCFEQISVFRWLVKVGDEREMNHY
jgi:hypothetical protein